MNAEEVILDRFFCKRQTTEEFKTMGMKINTELPLPANLKAEYPLPKELAEIKKKRDAEIREIFEGKSEKFVVIVGP